MRPLLALSGSGRVQALLLAHNRKRERKGAADIQFAFDPDPAAMAFHNLLADRQTQAEMCAIGRRLILVGTVKTPEDFADIALRNPNTCVVDRN